LQKLKFWCELCHKQCRDANGYKNHCTTEGHLRQVAIFSQNAGGFIDDYSKEFEKAFMELVRRRWRFKDILIKKAYNEFIQDKEHVHMNATRWLTLTEFAHHLAKAGLCDIRESEEGFVIRYIDRDPQREAKQAAMREREREELEQREIERRRLMKQVKAMSASVSNGGSPDAPPEALDSIPLGDTLPFSTSKPPPPISFSFNVPKASPSQAVYASSSSSTAPVSRNEELPITKDSTSISSSLDKKRSRTDAEEEEVEKDDLPEAKRSKLAPTALSASPIRHSTSESLPPPLSKFSTSSSSSTSLDSIKEEQEKRREREGRKDHWLHPNIVVKVLNKDVGGGQFYGQKGTIQAVEDTYVAKVRLESGSLLKVDQDDLETVLPALGSQLLIVNGAYRGERATLQSINRDAFNANVSILAGAARGRIVTKAYEDICKVV